MNPKSMCNICHNKFRQPKTRLRSIVLILLLFVVWMKQSASSQVEIVQVDSLYCTDSSGIIQIGQVYYNEQSYRKQMEALEILYEAGQINEREYQVQIDALRDSRYEIFIKGVVVGVILKAGVDLIRFFAR